jgi:tetratricopeptide (TPR) repeat protein
LKKHIFILLLLIPYWATSQLGGAGGLDISSLLDQSLNKISLTDSSSNLSIRVFSMLENNVVDYEIFDPITDYNSLFIPPKEGISNRDKNIFRTVIIYKTDTMTLDFINIEGPNAAANIDQMDSLVFVPGHYSYLRDHHYNVSYTTYCYRGYTPTTTKVLDSLGITKKEPIITSQYIIDAENTCKYYLHKAKFLLRYDHRSSMVIPLDKARRIGFKSNKQKEEYYHLRVECNNNNLKKAIAYLDSSIQINKSLANYQNRAYRLANDGRLDDALADYTKLIELNSNKRQALKNRARFLIFYKKDYKKAIEDLDKAIEINELDLKNIKTNSYNIYDNWYASLYVLRAQALYSIGKKKEAIGEWLNAIDKWKINQGVSYFDSIIELNKSTPELYLCRAMNRLCFLPHLSEEEIKLALSDLDSCKKLKYDNHLIYYYEAVAYLQVKNYRKAYKCVSKSIEINPDHAHSYLLRYRIKNEQVTLHNHNEDPDLLQFRKMSIEYTVKSDSLVEVVAATINWKGDNSYFEQKIIVESRLEQLELFERYDDVVSYSINFHNAISDIKKLRQKLGSIALSEKETELGAYNFLYGKLLLHDAYCPVKALIHFERAKEYNYQDPALDSLIKLDLSCSVSPYYYRYHEDSFNPIDDIQKPSPPQPPKIYTPEVIANYKRIENMQNITKDSSLNHLLYIEQLMLEHQNDSAHRYKQLSYLMIYDVNRISSSFSDMMDMDSTSVFLTYKIGELKYLFGLFHARFGACTWLQTAERKGYDISKYKDFSSSCESEFNLVKQVSYGKSGKYVRFLEKNIDKFLIVKDTAYNIRQYFTHTLTLDNRRYRKRLKKLKTNIISGGNYTFIIRVNGDTLPQSIQTYTRRSSNQTLFNRYGNITKSYTSKKIGLRIIRKEYSSNHLYKKTIYRNSIFKKKIYSNSFWGSPTRERTKVLVKIVRYDNNGKKKKSEKKEKNKSK